MTRFVAALVALLLASAAAAQNVTVIGPVTPGNVPIFNSATVIKDSGTAPTGAQTVNWINVKTTCAATGNGSTDDTSAINTCIAQFNAAGSGVLYFPAGTYKTTAALTAITANGIIRGDGQSAQQVVQSTTVTPFTQINSTSTTANVFTINSQSLVMRDLALFNTAGSAPVSGSGILVVSTHPDFKVDMFNLNITGFFIDVDRQAGSLWVMDNVFIGSPVLYGVKIRNTVSVDVGDWTITNSSFYANAAGSTSAIRVESSGGGKIHNIKINCSGAGCPGSYATGIDLNAPGGTSDLIIASSSIENVTGVGMSLVGAWPNIGITNCQLLGLSATTAIAISNNSQITINGILQSGFTNALTLSTVTNYQIQNVQGWRSTFDGFTSNPLLDFIPVNGTGRFRLSYDGANGSVVQGDGLYWDMGATGGVSFGTGGTGGGNGTSLFLARTAATNGNFELDAAIAGVGGTGLLLNTQFAGGWVSVGRPATSFSSTADGVMLFGTGTNGSTNGWFQWSGQKRVASDVSYTSTTALADITGLTVPLTAGRSYHFEAHLSFTDAAAGGIQTTIQTDGTLSATDLRYDGWITDSGSNGIKGNIQASAFGTAVASSTTTGTAGFVEIKGTITVANGGTMKVQAAQNTSNGTATVIKRGSSLIVFDMP